MNVEEILDAVHINYEQATDAPALSDEDGLIRLSLLQKVVDGWGRNNNTRWQELFTIETLGPITAGSTQIPLAEELHLCESFFLQGESRPMKVKKPWQVTGVEERYLFITGNPSDGYVLNLGWTPEAGDPEVGKTIKAVYYRTAAKPTKASDVLEMSDPYYAVDEVTAELFSNDDVDLYNKFHNSALQRLNDMREKNDQTVWGEENGIDNHDNDEGPTFG